MISDGRSSLDGTSLVRDPCSESDQPQKYEINELTEPLIDHLFDETNLDGNEYVDDDEHMAELVEVYPKELSTSIDKGDQLFFRLSKLA